MDYTFKRHQGMDTFTHAQKKQRESRISSLLTEAHAEHAASLRARAFYKVHNHNTSDDLVQTTFLKAWAYLVRGGNIHAMRSFLYHILNDLIVDEYRRRKVSSLDTMMEHGFDLGIDEPQRESDIIDGKEALGYIERLPKKYRRILHMRYVHGLTHMEIAAMTRQSRNTVAVQIHRGMKQLRALYRKQRTSCLADNN